jgi:mono/diheme cytochrome c family protein
MRILVIVVPALLLMLNACGTPRRSEALGNQPVPLSASAQRGQHVFMQHCNQCHVGGGGGLGPTLNDKPLPAFMVRFQVRHGLGAMPAFGEDKINARDLDELIAYLELLRRGAAARPAPPAS